MIKSAGEAEAGSAGEHPAKDTANRASYEPPRQFPTLPGSPR